MAEDVETQKLPALVTTTDYFDALVEEHNLEDKLRVIYNFEIQYKKPPAHPKLANKTPKIHLSFISVAAILVVKSSPTPLAAMSTC